MQALEFEAGQRSWQLQQDATHAAAKVQLRQEVASSQAAVEAQRAAQLADWAAEEQENSVRHHQVCCLLSCLTFSSQTPRHRHHAHFKLAWRERTCATHS